MPCYHCSIKPPLTKAKGKSLIAKAAYNARTQYRDERDGRLTKNYEDHGQVLASYVMYDDRIKAPDWVKDDHQKMLNEAVRGLRSNARQGQEIILGLIDEFDVDRNRWMLNDFLREQICRKTGHVVFVNIHPPSEKGDERNIHAHVLLMPKALDRDGFTKPLPSLTPQDYDRIRDKWAEYGARELHKEASRMRNDPELGLVRMYRGIDPDNPDQAQEGMMHFSTDRLRAADFGKVHYVDVTAEEMQKFERAHSGWFLQLEPALRNDWITADPAIIARMRPLNPEQLDLDAERYRWGHLKLTQDPKDRRSWNGNNQYDKAKERGDEEWMIHCDREPQRHLGPQGVAMDRKFQTRNGDINHDIRERNHHRRLMNELPIDKRPIPERFLHEALPVWWAYNCSTTAEQFVENLKKEKLILARATKDDAETSHTRHWARYGRTGGYYPILKEGEYIVVDEKTGHGFRLHEMTVGKTFGEVKRFLEPLDKKFVNDVRATENIIQFKFMRTLDPRPIERKGRRGVDRDGERKAGKTLQFAAAGVIGTLESVLAPRLTPEQKRDADVANEQRKDADVRSIEQRRREDEGFQRGYGGRDR